MSIKDIINEGMASCDSDQYVSPQSHKELYQTVLETISAGLAAGRKATAEGAIPEEINTQVKEVWEGHKRGLAADNLQEIRKIEAGDYDGIINLTKKYLSVDKFATVQKMYHNLLKGDHTLKAMYLNNHHQEDLKPALFALSKALGASSEKLTSTHASPGVKMVLDAVCNNVDWIDLAINADKKVQGSTIFKKMAQYKSVFDFTKNLITAPALNVDTITGIFNIYKVVCELINTDVVGIIMDDLRKGYNQENPQNFKELFAGVEEAVLNDNNKYSARVKELLAPTFEDWTKANTDKEKEKLLDKFAQIIPVESISEVREQLNKAREVQKGIDKSTKELDRQFVEEFLPSLKNTIGPSLKDSKIEGKYFALGRIQSKLKAELRILNQGYEILKEDIKFGDKKIAEQLMKNHSSSVNKDITKGKELLKDIKAKRTADKAQNHLIYLGVQNCEKDIRIMGQIVEKLKSEQSLSKKDVELVSKLYTQVSYDQKDFWQNDDNVASLISKQNQCLTSISEIKRTTYQKAISVAGHIKSSLTRIAGGAVGALIGKVIPRGNQVERTPKVPGV